MSLHRLAVFMPGALALFLSACITPPPPKPAGVHYERVSFADLPGWTVDDPISALDTFRKSCARILEEDPAATMGGISGTAGDWRVACRQAEDMARIEDMKPETARAFLETAFVPFRVTDNGAAQGQLTGYFEITVKGSRAKAPGYAVPIYKRPPDLIGVDLGLFRPAYAGQRIAGRVDGGALVPYADRAAIDKGALAGKGLELAWLADPVDAFFLSVQGSGRVLLPDGSFLRVGYDGRNGHPYRSIGKLLIERGEMSLEEVSMQSIRGWLEGHPDDAQVVLDANPSYIFFRAVDGDGPIGTEGVVLTPGRSLAVDARQTGLGTPVYLDGMAPGESANAPPEPLQRLMIAQDTGGAIKGALRGDVFWGSREAAAYRAGVMNAPAQFYVLLPDALADRMERPEVAAK